MIYKQNVRNTKHLVIIGGQAAGMSAASEARRIDSDLRITVIEKSDVVTYGKCSMPHYISGIADSPQTSYKYSPEELKIKKNIDVLISTIAIEINKFGKNVRVRDIKTNKESIISYDKLIIATGYTKKNEIFLGKKYTNAFGLNNINDAETIKRFVQNNSGKTAVIIGGGSLGLEMAWAFRSNFMEVHILEKENKLGDSTLEMNDKVFDILKENLVHLHLNCGSIEFIENTNEITGIRYNGNVIDCDMVFYSGVNPSIKLAETAKLEIGSAGGIKTGPNQLTSDENIYACGDCSEHICHLRKKSILSKIASTAVRSGYVAGTNAAGNLKKMSGILNPVLTKIFDFYLGTSGLGFEESKLFLGSEFAHKSIHGKELPGMMDLPNNDYYIDLFYNKNNYQIAGIQILSKRNMKRLDVITLAIKERIPLNRLEEMDYSYTPDYSSSMDPLFIISKISLD